jgi:hypothetical protein
MLSPEEYREFFRVCRANGHPYDDFEVLNFFFTGSDGRAYQFVSMVVIRHVRQNSCRTYTAGYGSYWLLRFESDLQKGCFDTMVPPHTKGSAE